jgi:hypothetical protein
MSKLSMEYAKLIAELRDEAARLQEAIEALERIARGGAKRRGRPPKWLSAAPKHETERPSAQKSKPAQAGCE